MVVERVLLNCDLMKSLVLVLCLGCRFLRDVSVRSSGILLFVCVAVSVRAYRLSAVSNLGYMKWPYILVVSILVAAFVLLVWVMNVD